VSLASYTSDSVRVAIDKLPLPGLKQTVIPLYASARAAGSYTLTMTELVGIPQIYEVWLMDSYAKDSLDMRKNQTYPFTISADTNSFGAHRFQLVIRQNDSLMFKLANFTGSKATGGSQLQWTTTNEQNYTHFTLERSTDGGTTFNIIYGTNSSSLGTYGFLDRSHSEGENLYRLKIEDLNGNVTYSNVVVLMYGNGTNNNVALYPNPTSGPLNLVIAKIINTNSPASQIIGAGLTAPPTVTNTYSIKIVSASGALIKTLTTTNPNWQTDVSGLLPGTYILQVVNKSDNSLIGKGTFVKL
jgi:hypothetical protein